MGSNEPIARSFMLLSFASAALLIWIRVQVSPVLKTLQAIAPIVVPTINQTLQASPLGAVQPTADVDTRLVVDLSDRQVQLYQSETLVEVFPIAVGQAGWETPTGSFQVIHMQSDPIWEHPITGEVVDAGPDNPLGAYWIGFWSDQSSQIGFHGTNQADLIGQAVSHGCIRMHNEDVGQLYEQVQVGTPVEVRS